jgi:hypothetical protein
VPGQFDALFPRLDDLGYRLLCPPDAPRLTPDRRRLAEEGRHLAAAVAARHARAVRDMTGEEDGYKSLAYLTSCEAARRYDPARCAYSWWLQYYVERQTRNAVRDYRKSRWGKTVRETDLEGHDYPGGLPLAHAEDPDAADPASCPWEDPLDYLPPHARDKITPRQLEYLKLFLAGLRNTEVEAALGVGKGTSYMMVTYVRAAVMGVKGFAAATKREARRKKSAAACRQG